jgi:hypothetical protein
MTWWRPEPVGIAVSIVWIAVIATARADHDIAGAVGFEQQIVYLAVAAIAAVALALRLGAAHTPGGYA